MHQQLQTGVLIKRSIETTRGSLFWAESPPAEQQKAVVLFVHGSPGSWFDYGDVLLDEKLRTQAQLLSIDRPGWGLSHKVVDGDLPLSATEIHAILLERNTRNLPVILVGHSYGVPIVLQLAVQQVEEVKGLLLLSGDIAPHLSKHRWYNSLARLLVVKWFLPKQLEMSNIEMLEKYNYIATMSKQYDVLNARVHITTIQGGKDSLVPAANSEYARKVFPDGKHIYLPKQGHLTHYLERELIKKEILAILQKI